MHVFDARVSQDVLGVDEAQQFWLHLEAIVGQWKSTKPGPETAHMAEILQQTAENMREADATRNTAVADYKRCNHGVPAHRHREILGKIWCPSMKKGCTMKGDDDLVPR